VEGLWISEMVIPNIAREAEIFWFKPALHALSGEERSPWHVDRTK